VFKIGEVAKMLNCSIQKLRHMDKDGRLKPSYVDPKTGYRYYTMQDLKVVGLNN
jgi:DNA-binding transcriptional MerR regulator